MIKAVLIVEDDEDTRAIYASSLAAHGYKVVTATQGAEGVHLARRDKPELILLDIRMPVMDGWATARYLKSYPETRNIPVIAISAHSPEDEQPGLVKRSGFDSYIEKPVDPRDIVAAVEARIGPPSPAAKVCIRFRPADRMTHIPAAPRQACDSRSNATPFPEAPT